MKISNENKLENMYINCIGVMNKGIRCIQQRISTQR